MAGGKRLDLAVNAGAGNTTDQFWPGGRMVFMAEATWGGGTAKLQYLTPNNTWVDYPSGSLTANGLLQLDVPPCRVRVNIATSTAVYVYAIGYLTRTQ